MSIRSLFNIPFVFALIATSSIIGFIPTNPTLYFGALLVLIFYFTLYYRIHMGSILMWLFILLCFLGLIINTIDPIFNVWMRFGLFILVTSVIGPVFDSRRLRKFKLNTFRAVLFILTILSIGSFICFFLGINYMRINKIGDLSQAGIFGGLTKHSMMLGPISGVSFCFLVTSFLAKKKDLSSLEYWAFVIGALFCLGSVILSSSRAAVISSIIAGTFIIWNFNRSSLTSLFKKYLYIIFIVFISFPLWSSLAHGVFQKQEMNVENGGMFSSREAKWEARTKEFYSSPLIGIGFASINPEFGDNIGVNGVVEPGSSWAALLSMTGLSGISIFTLLMGFQLKKLVFGACEKYYSTLLSSILILFLFHMIAEGYILAGGSFLFFLFWLTVGASQSYIVLNKIK